MKPNSPNEKFPDYGAPSLSVDVSSCCNADRIWGLSQVINERWLCQLPIWSAFDSLLSDTPTVTVSQGLPFYSGLPTDWGNMYTDLKILEGINVSV